MELALLIIISILTVCLYIIQWIEHERISDIVETLGFCEREVIRMKNEK